MSNTNTPADSFESRAKQAADILGLSVEKVVAGLLHDSIGIEEGNLALNMLSDDKVFRFQDFASVFGPTGLGIKMGKVRMAYPILAGSKSSGQIEKATVLDSRTVLLREQFGIKPSMATVPAEDLLRLYDPSLPADPVTAELKKRFGDEKIIVFKPDTKIVAINETLQRYADIQAGLPVPETEYVDSYLVETYPVGVVPDVVLDEDPLDIGVPLRHGRSVNYRMDWTPVSLEVRQFCRELLVQGEISLSDRRALAMLANDLAQSPTSVSPDTAIGRMYPEILAAFRKNQQLGKLPSLKMEGTGSTTKKNDPFSISGRKNRTT